MEENKHDNEQFKNYEEVGVDYFLNDNKPILNGIVKHRYSDFIVNEINPQGTIATLSRDVDVIKEINKLEDDKKAEEKKMGGEQSKSEEGPQKITVSEETKVLVADILQEDGKRLLEHIRRLNEGLCERTEELALSKFYSLISYSPH